MYATWNSRPQPTNFCSPSGSRVSLDPLWFRLICTLVPPLIRHMLFLRIFLLAPHGIINDISDSPRSSHTLSQTSNFLMSNSTPNLVPNLSYSASDFVSLSIDEKK
ncbi:hypothetical protein K435DRAFT_839343 [Dendrothele bispora CBS 962.96]|uniref:Uncharacterized protein n=1 Tax=Dendrothele bispora (strain CBS 962.96) TaxID=1314807 RepID=A0A4S8M0Y4_DENBC|nr:hypothetical protein K435DRAFT_839343 [Dendrothele bispora CBS 962.96]